MDISALTKAQQAATLGTLFGTQTTTANMDPMATLLHNQQQAVTLSAVGKSLGQAHAAALASGDARATAGLQQTIEAVTSSSLNANSFSVLQTINRLADQSPGALTTTLTNVNTLTTKNMGVAVTSYLGAVDTAFAQSGVTGVNELNTSVQQAFAKGGTDTAAVLQQLSTLFQQIQPVVNPAPATTQSPTLILANELKNLIDISG
jgi:hypothetical protein